MNIPENITLGYLCIFSLQVLIQRKIKLQRAAKQAKANGDKEMYLHYIKLYKEKKEMIAAAQSIIPIKVGELAPYPFANVSGTINITLII